MKKIITALTLGALIGTAAFADVDVSLNFRQRATLYAAYEGESKSVFSTDIYNGSGTDNLVFGLSGDIASFEMQLVSDEATTNKIRAKKLAASLFLGNLTLMAGTWSDGLANGAYRTKTDGDAGNLEGIDFEYKKLGSIFGTSPSIFVDNPVNHVNNGGENYALGATYNLKYDAGAVAFKGFYISNEKSDTTNADATGTTNNDGSWQGHALSFLVDARNDNLGQAELAFKVGQSKLKDADGNAGATALAFGAYLQPKIIQPLILTFGGAGSVVGGKFTDWSLDLRARYQVIPKKLSISSFHAFSAITSDGETILGAVKSTKGIAVSAAETGTNMGKLSPAAVQRDKIMSNNIMVRYNLNDKVSLIGIVADMIGFGKKGGADVKTAKGDDAGAFVQLRFCGFAQFFASSSAAITTGVVCSINDATNYMDVDGKASYWTWGIPMILRVKF